ncbi:MAG: SIR2 family NAD-dependent protein deacylase [Gammaproteobacteria bacterium]
MTETLEVHCRGVIKEISAGRVIPFLGAGVNLCGRPEQEPWQIGKYLPNSGELAEYLAGYFEYSNRSTQDLVRVSQYASVMMGTGPLYEELHKVFDANYQPTPVHTFFAQLPSVLRANGHHSPYQLIVTTNYDDVLERAFSDAKEPFDVVTYMADSKDHEKKGKFLHWTPDKKLISIERPNEYWFPLDKNRNLQRTVILKIHGAVDRITSDHDSYVITEDHYIDFLTRADISTLVPVTLAEKLKRSHYLFLGYSLSDWNLRVILYRIWGGQKLSYQSWAILRSPSSIEQKQFEQKLWSKRDVEILYVPLDEYVGTLTRLMQTK